MTKHTVVKDFAGTGEKVVAWSSLARPTVAEVIAVVQREFPDKDLNEVYIGDFFTVRIVVPDVAPKVVRHLRVMK